MQKTWLKLWCSAALFLCTGAIHAQTPTASIQSYYWCASSQAYYPYVSTCTQAWQAVPILPPVPIQKNNPPPKSALSSGSITQVIPAPIVKKHFCGETPDIFNCEYDKKKICEGFSASDCSFAMIKFDNHFSQCVIYRGMAINSFNMVISSLSKEFAKNALILNSDPYDEQQVKLSLINAAYSGIWKDTKKFSDVAFMSCMNGGAL